MNTLDVKNLSKTYNTFQLNNVSFTIPEGYIMGFIGENGAGKTTTINAMLNLIKKESGTVHILGKNMDEEEISIKQNIGFVSGESFYPKRKLKEITKVYKQFYPLWDEDTYHTLMERFNLDEDKKVLELSKGMKMKYQITLALSHQAKLLILDEPTSGLDPVARDNLLELFQSLVENGDVSIFFSTHITSDLEKCADYITFIQKGTIIESLSKDDLIDRYRIVSGSKDDLEKIKDSLVAYKTNSLGYHGLILRDKVMDLKNSQFGIPTLDDIMIYYAEKEMK
jgi:ABC-2 type transport system ATP-binding protein